MSPTRFTAELLRASASGFASMTVARLADRPDSGVDGDVDAWRACFSTIVLELAAAVEDGGSKHFADHVAWTRDAFEARKRPVVALLAGLEEMRGVLREGLPQEAFEPLPTILDAAKHQLESAGSEAGSVSTPHAELVAAYIDALRDGDGAKAIGLVDDAIDAGGLSVADVLDGVLVPVLREVGRLWHRGEIDVADEHFASQTTGRLLERLMVASPAPTPVGRTVLLSMVEGDAHELGLRIAAAYFELGGWRTISLGANTPMADLLASVQRHDPDLLVIGATLNVQRAAVARSIALVRDARPNQLVIVGGPAFASLDGREERAKDLGAAGCAAHARDAVRIGADLLGL